MSYAVHTWRFITDYSEDSET